MVHPGYEHRVYTDSLACRSVQVEFFGRAAHAVAHPEKGINALDALIQLFIAIEHIRKSGGRDVSLPGGILHGGVRANVVPDRSVGQFSIRASTAVERDGLIDRLRRTVEAIASATGCQGTVTFIDNPYDEMITNRTLAAVYGRHLASESITTVDGPREHKGSLDMGNVSYRVAAIHPYVAIAPPEVASHTPAFAEATVSERGEQATLLSARTLAKTAVDLMGDAELLARVRREFAEHRAKAGAGRGAGSDTPDELIMERP
jgi:metal-dependent amidase/aminoacylase/carboxypeptidase family protein